MTGSRLARVAVVAIFVAFAVVPLESAGERSSATKAKDRPGGSSTPLSPLHGGEQGGTARITRIRGEAALEVMATLPQSRRGEAYQVWLYNSRRDARSLGAQVADKRRRFKGAGPLPPGYRRYRYLDVSRERIAGSNRHSGRSVLRGPVPVAERVGAGQTIARIPDVGQLAFICDSRRRSSTTFTVRSATVFVSTSSRGRRLWRGRQVDPVPQAGTLATPFERVRRQRWRIVYRHKPATIVAVVDIRFGAGDCVVLHVITDVKTRPN